MATNNSVRVETIDLEPCRLLRFPSPANRVSLFVLCFAFLLPKSRISASGESCAVPPDQCPTALKSRETWFELRRSGVGGLAVAPRNRKGLARRTGDVLNEFSRRRIFRSSFDFYKNSRTPLAWGKDALKSRALQLPDLGPVIELPQVGGRHHRYQRRAA